MRPTLVRVLQLRLGAADIVVPSKRHAPRIVRGGQIRRESDRLRVCLLRRGPIALAVQDIGAEAIAVDKGARRLEDCVGTIGVARGFLGRSNPTRVAIGYGNDR